MNNLLREKIEEVVEEVVEVHYSEDRLTRLKRQLLKIRYSLIFIIPGFSVLIAMTLSSKLHSGAMWIWVLPELVIGVGGSTFLVYEYIQIKSKMEDLKLKIKNIRGKLS